MGDDNGVTRRRIYLHVGCRKSGTSYLQSSIWESRRRLEAHGLGFPLVGRGDHVQILLDPLRTVQPGRPVPARVHRAMRTLRERLAATRQPAVLLTLEDLAELPLHQVQPLMQTLTADEVHLIITAREWSRQIPSEWQQQVKERYTGVYLDFVRALRDDAPDGQRFRARQDVSDVAARWGAGLSPEHVHVIAVPPSGEDPLALFRLFASVVGVPPAAFTTPKIGRNPSLGYAQAETLRRVNVALGDRLTDLRGGYRYGVRTFLATRVLAKQTGRKPPFPEELVGWCHEETLAGARRLRDAGYDIVGSLDDLVSPLEVAGAEPTLELTEDEIAEAAVAALAEVACLRNRERNTQPESRPLHADRLLTRSRALARRLVGRARWALGGVGRA